MLRIAAAGLVALGLAAGCTSGAVGEARAWADRACRCKDAACAVQVREEFATWVEDNRELRGSRSERKRIEDSASRLFQCLDGQAAAASAPPE